MAFRSLLLFFLCLAFIPIIQSNLTADYYQKSCPKFSEIIKETATKKQQLSPTAAAATLRLFFQDCLVNGCDASILVSSNFYNAAERDADINDVITPGKFDNMYYKNLQKKMGLLASGSALVTDTRTKPFVDMYAANQSLFFQDFAHAMQKLSVLKVKTGNEGEVRNRCDSFN